MRMKTIEEIERDKDDIEWVSVDRLKKYLCGYVDDCMERMGKEKKTGISKMETGKFMFCIEDVVMTNKNENNEEVLTLYLEIDSELQEEKPEVLN